MVPRSMPMTMSTLRRFLAEARSTKFGKIPTSTSLVARAFSQRAIGSRLLTSINGTQSTAVTTSNASSLIIDRAFLRSYVTATKKKSTTKKTTKKAAAKKKPAKKTAKKTTKKTKKTGTKKAVKPKTPKFPRVRKLPPSRAVNSYALFVTEEMKHVTGHADIGSRAKEVAARWRALSDAQKNEYKTRASALSASRKQEYENAVSNLSPAEIREENRIRRLLKKTSKRARPARTRLIKDPNAPKRPQSPFIKFCMEQGVLGASHPQQGLKEAGSRWRSMSDAEKRPYTENYQNELARYQKEKAAHYAE